MIAYAPYFVVRIPLTHKIVPDILLVEKAMPYQSIGGLTRIAVLDDYFNAARKLANWNRLEGRAEITVFQEPFGGEEAAARNLADFEIISRDAGTDAVSRPPAAASSEIKASDYNRETESVL